MIKYTFVAFHRDMLPFLQRLQELGVVDVSRRGYEPGDEEQAQLQLLGRYDAAEKILKQIADNEGIEQVSAARYSAEDLLAEVEVLFNEKQQLEAEKKKLEKEADALRPWGDFSVETVKKLKEQGVNLHFFICQERAFNEAWSEQYAISKIAQTSTEIYFVLALPEVDEPWILDGVQEQKAPASSFRGKEAEAAKVEERIQQLDARLKELVVLRETFKPAKQNLLNAMQLQMAQELTTHEADATLAILEGYCPVTQEKELSQFLDNQDIIYFSEKVDPEEDAPVLLKNNRFAKLFEPITKLYSLPGYNELDITPLFAPFFMLFFGFCLGDGGYGLLILLAMTFIKKKVPAGYRGFVTLAQWMGAATVLFGCLTGTFFGIALVDIEALKNIRSYFINQDNLMMLSLILGFIQIIFGMGVKVANILQRQSFKYALGQIATMLLILSSAAYIGLPMIGVTPSNIVNYSLLGLIILSALVFFFYNTPGKNPILNFGSGLWNFYNLITGLLGDMLSYIRLFALGLTGGILGGVFNSLALQMNDAFGGVIGVVGMLFILLFGHSLNFMLNILGAVVHPLRLTFVEFYKNAGFEGGGRKYDPLKVEKN